MSQKSDDAVEDSSSSPREFVRTTSSNPFYKRTTEQDTGAYTRDEDLYEEPDRDTDGSSGFYEHTIEDDAHTEDEPTNLEASSAGAFSTEPFDAEPTNDSYDDLVEEDSFPTSTYSSQPSLAVVGDTTNSNDLSEHQDDNQYDDPDDAFVEANDDAIDDDQEDEWDDDQLDDQMSAVDEQDDWLEERAYVPEEPDVGQAWPLGLIAVAVLALILLVAGGYGVIQQRSATQEEILELRAALATAASPQEVSESRNTAAEFEQRNIQLKEQLFNLSAENRRLKDTVAGLEVQLAVLQKSASPGSAKATPVRIAAAAPPKPATPAPKVATPVKRVATATPATPSPTSGAPSGGRWFVNFGSYGQAAAAQSWVTKLQPEQGNVITAPGVKNGRTFYRVRVVGLPTKASAQKVARAFEQEYGLPKLWIGQQD